MKIKQFYIPKIALLFVLLGISQFLNGQNAVVFDRISTGKGLSQGDVNAIYQDSKGFMWFATHDGLNKYNGYEFTVYKPIPNKLNSINSNLIYALTGDDKGNLWIGTTGNGLNFYNKSTGDFKHFLHEANVKNSISNNHINVLFKDSKNLLWIGTVNGLDLVDLKQTEDNFHFKNYNLVNNTEPNSLYKNNIYSIFEDHQNQLWIGSSSGLFMRSRDNNGKIYFKPFNKQINLPDDTSVQSITQDKTGRLILGTSIGLYVYNTNGNGNKALKIHNGYFNDLQIDNKNNIWAGSNNGLLYFDNQQETNIPLLKNKYVYDPKKSNSISKNIIKSLYIDNTGILWIGTNGGGINKMDPERKQFKLIKKTLDNKSLSYDKIRSIFEDSNNNLWIGTEGGGLNILPAESKTGDYSNFINLRTVLKPFAIEELADSNTILIGAESTPGLYQIKVSDVSTLKESDLKAIPEVDYSVFSILEDSNKNLWIGTYNRGLFRWLKTNNGYKKDILTYSFSNPKGLPNNIIRNIFEDKNHNIWLGTADGLSKLVPSEITKDKPEFITYKNNSNNKNSISHNYILELFESEKGEFWIGTFGGGLNKMSLDKTTNTTIFKSFTEADGLANDVVKGILEDSEHNLWISTNKGLSKFNTSSKTFKNYDVNDGLQSNEFQELARFKRKSGEMIFGGVNGFNAFYPLDIKDNPYKAKSIITNLSISNTSIKRGEKINGRVILKKPIDETSVLDLKHGENSFSFEFTALHYSAPTKNKFAHKLEGFDTDWIYTNSSKRFATYTNLEHGDYTLKLKASNNDGIWQDTATEIK